jgi:hypothetical protein
MSTAIEIFVAGPVDRGQMSEAVQAARADVTIREGDEPGALRFFTSGLIGDIRANPYETDGPLDMSNFPWVIEFETTGVSAEANARTFAAAVAGTLGSRPGVRLLQTASLGRELARHEPESLQ